MPFSGKTKLVFFGTEDFSLRSLEALIKSNQPIAVVVTKPDTKKNRGQKLVPPAVKVLAEQHDIPVWQPEKLKDIFEDLCDLGPITGVLVSYGKIIPQSIIDLFTPGIINVHPSLLPLYRGPTPIESAIINGDPLTGVSIMQLSAAMDAGPVYTQRKHALYGDETQPALYETLSRIGAEMLVESLPAILEGSLTPHPQDEASAVYCHLLQKEDAPLRPDQLTAVEAERKVRAHLKFPRTRVTINSHDIIITKAKVSAQKETPLDIECRDGEYLSVMELIAPSGKTMDGTSFLRGYID
jgi:methionyl-tRNA formyltransferase